MVIKKSCRTCNIQKNSTICQYCAIYSGNERDEWDEWEPNQEAIRQEQVRIYKEVLKEVNHG